jgi:hypothetical protein
VIGSDETLQSVLSQVFFEFMDGDFEVIRNMISKWRTITLRKRVANPPPKRQLTMPHCLILTFFLPFSSYATFCFLDTMNNTAGGVRLGDDVIGVIEEMFLRLRFILHGKQRGLQMEKVPFLFQFPRPVSLVGPGQLVQGIALVP